MSYTIKIAHTLRKNGGKGRRMGRISRFDHGLIALLSRRFIWLVYTHREKKHMDRYYELAYLNFSLMTFLKKIA